MCTGDKKKKVLNTKGIIGQAFFEKLDKNLHNTKWSSSSQTALINNGPGGVQYDTIMSNYLLKSLSNHNANVFKSV